MQSKLFIHATNIHQGGGRALLAALLKALSGQYRIVALLDSRMPLSHEMTQGIEIQRIEPSVIERFNAERWLANNVTSGDIALCFGNLPPLFKLRGHTVVFVQNRYLIDDVKLNGFSLKVRLRLAIERLWLAKRMSNASEFVVQTPSMKRLLEIKTHGRVPVRVLPFIAEPNGYAGNESQANVQKVDNCGSASVSRIALDHCSKRNLTSGVGAPASTQSFVYVASGEPHKNHRRLIEAWCLLAEEGLFPLLYLTLDETRFAALYATMAVQRQQYGLQVINAGELSHKDVLALYNKADALIYPSTFESFGLPLIEAGQAGLPVLAAELDYVRDVLDPEQTFDPNSAISIARAVKRFIGVDEQPLPLLDAKQFIVSVLANGE
jgi:glycosyltransferase involved in cell wall biosynthesis